MTELQHLQSEIERKDKLLESYVRKFNTQNDELTFVNNQFNNALKEIERLKKERVS